MRLSLDQEILSVCTKTAVSQHDDRFSSSADTVVVSPSSETEQDETYPIGAETDQVKVLFPSSVEVPTSCPQTDKMKGPPLSSETNQMEVHFSSSETDEAEAPSPNSETGKVGVPPHCSETAQTRFSPPVPAKVVVSHSSSEAIEVKMPNQIFQKRYQNTKVSPIDLIKKIL